MGLKNKNSIFDLSNGPVSDMETQQGPQFQRTIDEATDKSIASLGEVPITSQFQDLNGVPDSFYNRLDGTVDSPFQSRTGDHMVDLLTDNAKSINSVETYTQSPNKSQFQDLNGVPGPQSQLPIPDASQRHVDSLTKQIHIHNGGPSTNHYNVGPSNLDLGGVKGPESQLPKRDASERHVDSLTKQIQITNKGVGIFTEPYHIDPSTLDLNGGLGPQFDGSTPQTQQQTLHTDSLIKIYNSNINPLASYGAGQPGGTWPSVNNANLDLNATFDSIGNTPLFEGTTPQFEQQTLHTDLLVNRYKSRVNPGASYGAGQPGGTWPTVRPSPLGANFADLDGLTPTGYTNPDTGVSY